MPLELVFLLIWRFYVSLEQMTQGESSKLCEMPRYIFEPHAYL